MRTCTTDPEGATIFDSIPMRSALWIAHAISTALGHSFNGRPALRNSLLARCLTQCTACSAEPLLCGTPPSPVVTPPNPSTSFEFLLPSTQSYDQNKILATECCGSSGREGCLACLPSLSLTWSLAREHQTSV